MREVFTHQEQFSFVCLHCGERWHDMYEVQEWHVVDEDYLAYRRDGQPAAAPTTRTCRDCGGYQVRMLPTHAPYPSS